MPRGGVRPPATCHSDRAHFAKGMCQHCYRKASKPRDRKAYNKKYHWETDHRRRHSFTPEDEIRYNSATICDWCGHLFDGRRPQIDHDHLCCNSAEKHCTKCTRGFVHPQCNAWAINYYEWQEREFGVTDPKLADYRRRFPVPRVAGQKDPQERPVLGQKTIEKIEQ